MHIFPSLVKFFDLIFNRRTVLNLSFLPLFPAETPTPSQASTGVNSIKISTASGVGAVGTVGGNEEVVTVNGKNSSIIYLSPERQPTTVNVSTPSSTPAPNKDYLIEKSIHRSVF